MQQKADKPLFNTFAIFFNWSISRDIYCEIFAT